MNAQEMVSAATPVNLDELKSFQAVGEEFSVPEPCVGCLALDPKKIAEGLGMIVVSREGEQQFFPASKIGDVKEEEVRRADDAVSGACRFIVQQQCWRYEEVKE
ncbi:MAG: hypothetical protein ACREGG_05055 [Candidatus Saccharimonadales bacterium]